MWSTLGVPELVFCIVIVAVVFGVSWLPDFRPRAGA